MQSKVIGKGANGCVLRPALPCGRVLASSADSVSKVSRNKTHGRAEFDMAEMVEAVDPHGKFTVSSAALCKIPAAKQAEIEAACGFPAAEHVVQPYGGISMQELVNAGAPPMDLLRAMLPIFRGMAANRAMLEVMDDITFSHGDIKPDNIVVGADGQARLIDFSSQIATMTRVISELNNLRTLTPQQLDSLRYADASVDVIYTIARARRILHGIDPMDSDVVLAGFFAVSVVVTFGMASHLPMDFVILFAARGQAFKMMVLELITWHTDRVFKHFGYGGYTPHIVAQINRAIHLYTSTANIQFPWGAFDMYSLGIVLMTIGLTGPMAERMLCANPWERATAPQTLVAIEALLGTQTTTPRSMSTTSLRSTTSPTLSFSLQTPIPRSAPRPLSWGGARKRRRRG